MKKSYEELLKNIKLNQKEKWNMIVVDGVVGAGKSTLMKILADERNLVSFEEPVINNPILSKFYYDRPRYSFPLQVFFLNKRFEHIKEASKLNNAVLDRSVYGDVIFAKMLHDAGEMSTEEFDIYIELFNNMIEHVQSPKLMIYLEISVDESVKRINKRGRDYELITERKYWEELNDNYREYFNHYKFSPILKINIDNLDFENNIEDKKYVLSLIDNAINSIDNEKIEQ